MKKRFWLLLLIIVALLGLQSAGPWKRHVVDDSHGGADGVQGQDAATGDEVKIGRVKRATGTNYPGTLSSGVSSPQLLFSDLTHGPKSGWSAAEPDKGAAVTIWGRGFGDSRGSSYVTVNGVDLVSDADYAEWNADSYDIPFLRRITFWLNSSCRDGAGTISVTVNGTTSQSVPFSVIDGGIYFVDGDHASEGTGTLTDPYQHLGRAVLALNPGDVLYLRETTTPYSEKYGGGHQNLYLPGWSRAVPVGTSSAPIAVVGYPSEAPHLEALDLGRADSCITLGAAWWTISKLRMTSEFYTVMLTGEGDRIVGCECVGCTTFGTGAAIINTGASQHAVYANSAHGGRTDNKLDHAIYVSGNPSNVAGANVAWNFVYDNSFARGPMLVINHQQDRIPAGEYCKEHRIHHNWIDTSTYPSRAIGIYSMGWDVGSGETEPEMAYIYNNVIVGGGEAVLYAQNGNSRWYNNTLYNCTGVGFQAGGVDTLSCHFKNNIVHMAGGYYFKDLEGSADLVLEKNLWYGVGECPAEDIDPLNADPLFVDAVNNDFAIQAESPARDAGTQEAAAEVLDDFIGSPRATLDIGAYEFVATP